MSNVTVEFTGWREFIERMKHVPDVVKADADDVLREVAESMAGAVRERYAVRSGKLRRGVRVRRLAAMAYQVKSGAPHAHLYEQGTRPRRTRTGANRGVMPRFGPIFAVEKMRASSRVVRRLEHVLANAARGAGSPTGVGML